MDLGIRAMQDRASRRQKKPRIYYCGAIRDQWVSVGDSSQIQIRAKAEKKIRRGREFTATNLRQDRQQEGNIRDYLKSLCLKHKAKKLPPKALLSIMWLSPSARCWLSSEIEVNRSSHCEDNSAAPAQACGRIHHPN